MYVLLLRMYHKCHMESGSYVIRFFASSFLWDHLSLMSGNGSCWKMNIKKRMRLWWQRPPSISPLAGQKTHKTLSWRIFQLGNLVVSVLTLYNIRKRQSQFTKKNKKNKTNKKTKKNGWRSHQRSFLYIFFSNSPPNFFSLESLKSECGKKKKVPLSMIIQQKKSLPIFHVCVERTDTHTHKSLTHSASQHWEREKHPWRSCVKKKKKKKVKMFINDRRSKTSENCPPIRTTKLKT